MPPIPVRAIPPAYAAEFAAMKPKSGTWLLTHRPVWGFGPRRRTVNATLQEALANWNGKLPDGIALALAGHIHVVEVLSFADKRSPQFVLGTGGTLLAGKIKTNLTGETIARHAGGLRPFRPPLRLRDARARAAGLVGRHLSRYQQARSCSAARSTAGQIACD